MVHERRDVEALSNQHPVSGALTGVSFSIMYPHSVDYNWLPINTRMVPVVTGDVTGDYPLLRH